MSKWLQSGRRRDICVVVAGAENPTQQSVKRELEAKDGERIRPNLFFGAVEKLENAGLLEREADGVHDRLTLTDAGEERLREHRAWEREHLADWAGEQ